MTDREEDRYLAFPPRVGLDMNARASLGDKVAVCLSLAPGWELG